MSQRKQNKITPAKSDIKNCVRDTHNLKDKRRQGFLLCNDCGNELSYQEINIAKRNNLKPNEVIRLGCWEEFSRNLSKDRMGGANV